MITNAPRPYANRTRALDVDATCFEIELDPHIRKYNQLVRRCGGGQG